MADAEAQNQVELGLLLVEQERLTDWVAHRFGLTVSTHRLRVGDSDEILGDCAVFADDGHHLEAVIFEDVDDLLRLLEQSGAECQPNLMIACAVQELDNLHHSGVLAVAAGFGQRRTVGNPMIFLLLVELLCLLLNRFIFARALRKRFGHILLGAASLKTFRTLIHDSFLPAVLIVWGANFLPLLYRSRLQKSKPFPAHI